MQDENQAPGKIGSKSLVVPGPRSIEYLLKYVDPAPDAETEAFVAAIYADRREGALPQESE
jgi:hypothetical protein